MTTIIIEDNNPQAKKLLEYIKTLPYATIIDGDSSNSFEAAAEECNAMTVDVFFDKLNEKIEEWDK